MKKNNPGINKAKESLISPKVNLQTKNMLCIM